MKHDFEVYYKNLKLRQIKYDDIELLRIWRNDKIATRFLRPIGEITQQMQESWYNSYLNNKNELALVIEECKEINSVIGSISLYDFNGSEAEFGKFMIGNARAHGKGYGRQSLVMALKLGFETLNINRILAEVHTDNIAAYSNYIRVGCRVIGTVPSCVGGLEYKLEIDRQAVKTANLYYDEIEVKM